MGKVGTENSFQTRTLIFQSFSSVKIHKILTLAQWRKNHIYFKKVTLIYSIINVGKEGGERDHSISCLKCDSCNI